MKEKGIRVWVLFSCLLLSLSVCRAQPLSQDAARRMAREFFRQSSMRSGVGSRTADSVRLVRSSVASGRFLFQGPGARGFVLYGGTEQQPILMAYSREAPAPEAALPEAFTLWMEGRSEGLVSPESLSESAVVQPILDVRWFQTDPYNGLCPYYTDDQGQVSSTRCVVGCVATAYAQLLYHYRYPEALCDTLHGWSTPHYVLDDVLPGTPLSWELIRPDYLEPYTDAEAEPMQRLNLYCGMASRMNYGLVESGSSIQWAVDNMRRVFGYQYVRFVDRYLYTPQRWHALLQQELRAGRPVVYSGFNVRMEGHAFLLDGVDVQGFYHINWGSGGIWDGYFNLDVLNWGEWPADETEQGRNLGYFCNQGAVLMHPEPVVNGLLSDTVAYADSLVRVEEVRFARQPDVSGYVPVDIRFRNLHPDTVHYTFEMFTFQPQDTAVFEQAEYLGVSGAVLPPGESVPVRAYCRFGRVGDFLFGTSSDDVHVTYQMPVHVEAVLPAQLRFSDVRLLSAAADSLVLVTTIHNDQVSGCFGDWVVYSLSRSGTWREMSHPRFLEISGGSEIQDTVVFRALPADTEYLFRVSYPTSADVQAELRVVTLPVSDIELPVSDETNPVEAVYTFDGRLIYRSEASEKVGDHLLPKGFYLVRFRNGRTEKIYRD